jgi:hypothetical protein
LHQSSDSERKLPEENSQFNCHHIRELLNMIRISARIQWYLYLSQQHRHLQNKATNLNPFPQEVTAIPLFWNVLYYSNMLLASFDSKDFVTGSEKENEIAPNIFSPELRTPRGSDRSHENIHHSDKSVLKAVTPGENSAKIMNRHSFIVSTFISPEETKEFTNCGSMVHHYESSADSKLQHDCTYGSENMERSVNFDDEYPHYDADSDLSFGNIVEPLDSVNSFNSFHKSSLEKCKTSVTPLTFNRGINDDDISHNQRNHLISAISFPNTDIEIRDKGIKRKNKKKKKLKKEKKAKRERAGRGNVERKRPYSNVVCDEEIVSCNQQSMQNVQEDIGIRGRQPKFEIITQHQENYNLTKKEHHRLASDNEATIKASKDIYKRGDSVEEDCSSYLDDGLEIPYDSPVPTSKVEEEGFAREALRKTSYSNLECNYSELYILCSESFIETSSKVVTALSSRIWAAKEQTDGCHSIMSEQPLRKKIILHDSWLLDEIGIDLELMDNKSIFILRLSSLEKEVEIKAFVRNMIRLSACGRYKEIYVIIYVDVLISASISKDIAFLQSAPLGNTDCTITFQYSTDQTIAQAIADIAMDSQSVLDAPTLAIFSHHFLQASFLLQIASTLTIHECIFLLTSNDGKSSRSVSKILEAPDTRDTSGMQLHMAANVSLR